MASSVSTVDSSPTKMAERGHVEPEQFGGTVATMFHKLFEDAPSTRVLGPCDTSRTLYQGLPSHT